jgi:hypothetical protein
MLYSLKKKDAYMMILTTYFMTFISISRSYVLFAVLSIRIFLHSLAHASQIFIFDILEMNRRIRTYLLRVMRVTVQLYASCH